MKRESERIQTELNARINEQNQLINILRHSLSSVCFLLQTSDLPLIQKETNMTGSPIKSIAEVSALQKYHFHFVVSSEPSKVLFLL